MLRESIRRISLRIPIDPVRPSGIGSKPRTAACCLAVSKSIPAISKIASAVARCTHPSMVARPRLSSGAARSNDSPKGVAPITSHG